MQLKETSKKRRLVNFVADLIAIALLIEITIQIEAITDYKTVIRILRVAIVFGGYYISMEYFLGKTVGKYLTGSRVVNQDGSRITLRTAILRFLCRFIPFEFLSLALGYDAKAWHDTLTKTLVVDDKKIKA